MRQNKRDSVRNLIGFAVLAWIGLVIPVHGQTGKDIEFVTSKGMQVKLISDPELGFVHAQLLLFYNESVKVPPTVSYLTLFQLFEEIGRHSTTDVSQSLRRMGNDFTIQQTPEYLYLTCNFLPDRLGTFSTFLRQLFSFQGLTLKRFSEIKADFGIFFRELPDWEKNLAFQTAYSCLFNTQRTGPVFMDSAQVQSANLAQVMTFYRKNFLPERAVLVVRGLLNPYQMRGFIEKEFASFADRKPYLPTSTPPSLNVAHRVLLVDVPELDMPHAYFFDTAPALDNPSLLSFFIINYTLFNYPFGRIYYPRAGSTFSMRNILLSNEILSHRYFSLICTHARAAPGDLENLISMVEQEKKRLGQQGINRNEFDYALNFLNGKTQVDTGAFEYDTSLELNRFLGRRNENYLAPSVENLQRVSFESISGVVEEFFLANSRSGLRERGVIVILGNAATVLGSLRNLKPEIVRFIK